MTNTDDRVRKRSSKSVDGSAGHQTPQTDGQDEASTQAIRSAGTQGEASSGRTGYGDAQLEVSRSPIPTIRISSDFGSGMRRFRRLCVRDWYLWLRFSLASDFTFLLDPEPAHTAAETFPEPQHAANGDAKGKQKATLKLEDETAEESELSFSNKRLCERWLGHVLCLEMRNFCTPYRIDSQILQEISHCGDTLPKYLTS
jgi:hypothetical protein